MLRKREGSCSTSTCLAVPVMRPMVDWLQAIADHEVWIRTSLYARLGEAQAVDEVMQEVSLAACGLKTPLLEPQKAGAWLYRVAIRQAMLFRRRRGRHARMVDRLNQQVSSRPVEQASPLDFLLSRERGELVRDAMKRLDARDIEILLLRYTQEWSCQEMAKHLGVSLSCIETRLHRARYRLRTELNDCFSP